MCPGPLMLVVSGSTSPYILGPYNTLAWAFGGGTCICRNMHMCFDHNV